jgi:hypothetical protein
LGERLPGLVPDAATLGMKRQIHAAGRLHAIAQAGTLTCRRNPHAIEPHKELTESLNWSLRNTELVRLQLVAERPDQVIVEWPGE